MTIANGKLAWTAAAVLTAYGAGLTFVGLLLQAGVLSIPADADHHALRWHVFFWDPWFWIWGVALTTASVQPASRATQAAGVTPDSADGEGLTRLDQVGIGQVIDLGQVLPGGIEPLGDREQRVTRTDGVRRRQDVRSR
jgi:hypothetical protein